MIYPDFIKKGDTIGITAPSEGNKDPLDYIRLDHGIETLQGLGYHTAETPNVRMSKLGRSSDGNTRAVQLADLFCRDEVKWIISAKGGDFLCEMLSYTDYSLLKEHPKWIQGYSDNTSLLFILTTCCDIATIYGNNFNDFGMAEWHESIQNNYKIVTGDWIIQESFGWYEDGFHEKVSGLEGYVPEAPVLWANARNERKLTMEGRLIGGCLDVLLMLCGTRFDYVKEYINRYKEDGILWYLESFDLSSEALIRGLWQLKEAGWFQYVKGFCFGRPCMHHTDYGIPYQEAVMHMLEEFNVPVILDADIGHKSPQFTVINGAMGRFESEGGKGSLAMWKK